MDVHTAAAAATTGGGLQPEQMPVTTRVEAVLHENVTNSGSGPETSGDDGAETTLASGRQGLQASPGLLSGHLQRGSARMHHGDASAGRTPTQKRLRAVQGTTVESGMQRGAKRPRLPSEAVGSTAAMARAGGTHGSPSMSRDVEELQAQLRASQAGLQALQARLTEEQANRPAAALQSMCSGIDVDEVAAIVQRAGVDPKDITPYPPDVGCGGTVFGIQHVRDTAGKVLAASSYTPAGILRSVLLEVAKPDEELSSVLLAHVMAYIQQEAERCGWTPRQRAHLGGANALAATLSNKTISQWRTQQGGVTLECMQVWPIVRQALAVVFEQLHGYGGCALAPCAVLTAVAAPLPVMSP